MVWDMGDGVHEGSLCAVVPDGRTSLRLGGGVVLVSGVTGLYQRHPDMPDHEIVPDDEVSGWRAMCACGWRGPVWVRVSTSTRTDTSKRRAFVPFLGDAVPSIDVDDALRQEWKAHAGPASALSELEAAARAVERAQERLDRGVRAARKAGVSWAGVGSAVGVTRQSAHTRWSGSEKFEAP